ncbi:MAG: geranylgeranylglycerol-phosphate geranylgeranyltransferase [Crocinitomicaceae bacterium]|nr:geranylgeranylglycerol-phosphate geranylgeranyltransferase [Crocinitomicaceae bacterium]
MLIIAATMYSLRYFIIAPLCESASIGIKAALSPGLFFLSCLVMILLAAAGNIINDYFDRKVDQINKPERIIIGKKVKRRVAIILHQSCNIIATVLTVVLCYKTGLWWALLFPIIIATILWWYSPVLKRMPLAGNLAVAICVAAVPVWTGYFEILPVEQRYSDMLADPAKLFSTLWEYTGGYAAFAFVLTLIREALKDMEDLKGDTAGGYRTLPIYAGIGVTKKYIAALIGIVISLIAFAIYFLYRMNGKNWLAVLSAFFLIVFPLLVTLYKTLSAKEKKEFSSASIWAKLTMAGGIAYMYFIASWIDASQ